MDQYLSATNAHSAPSELWWLIFGTVCIGFCVYSIILTYHWFAYGLDARVAWTTSIFYYSVSALLLFVLALSALALSLS